MQNVALRSIRYGVGLCAIAAITTAVFLDAGLIIEGDRRLLVDYNKVKRHKKLLNKEYRTQCQIGNINCISFDECHDSTKVLLEAYI